MHTICFFLTVYLTCVLIIGEQTDSNLLKGFKISLYDVNERGIPTDIIILFLFIFHDTFCARLYVLIVNGFLVIILFFVMSGKCWFDDIHLLNRNSEIFMVFICKPCIEI